MKTKQTTKHALWASVTAIALCMVMLVGTTFAWFTDTASTGVNKIQAGTLDVKLMYSNDNMATWKEATTETKLFDDNALWEPGYTQVAYLKVVNAGNLALKYEVGFSKNYTSNRGKNVNGEWYRVDNYLKVGTVQTDAAFDSREAVWAAIATSEKTLAKDVMFTNDWVTLNPKEESKPFAVAIYMPTSVGNEANASKNRPATVTGLGVEVRATQATVESDSFGITYDENAATVLKRVEYTDGEHVVTGNIQAMGEAGAIHATDTAKITVDATTVYASKGAKYAMAVCASQNSKITIKGGDFANQASGDTALALIYAEDNAKIVIEGGTFKCVTPEWTLNCNDSDAATITVKGGSFYKFDPSNVIVGEGEIIVADGYHVEHEGDWYKVVPNN